MQRLRGTGLCALVAENTLRSVFPFAGFFVDLHIHGTDPQALSAVNAFALIAVDAQQREIAHGLEKNRDGTKILAERAVVLEHKSKRDSRDVIERVSGEEQPEHNPLQVCGLHQEQARYQRQRQCEHHIAQHAQLFLSRLLRLLVGQKIQHHRCPAGIASPAASKKQRTEDLRHGVVDGRRFKGTEEQIVPETLDLHILAGDNAKVEQYIAAYRQLHEMAGIALSGGKQRRPQPEAGSDVAEIQQVEQVVLREPQRDRHRFKQQKQQQRRHIFAKALISFRHRSLAHQLSCSSSARRPPDQRKFPWQRLASCQDRCRR